MLDQQQMSAMMAALQQALQILQQAGGGGAPGGGMDGGMGAPPDDGGGMDDDDMDMDDDGGDDPSMGGDDGGGGSSLHDRVSQLEDHTGLQKSAGVPLSLRLDKLESEVLGQEYEGPAVQRVRQLEKSLGIQARSRRSRRGGSQRGGGAPDVIKLDDLFKSAVSQGVAQALEEMGVDRQPSDLPDPETLRKNARQTQNTYGQRRGTARSVTDADLVKSAESWGFSEDELDEPVGFADALQMQYLAAKNGMNLAIFADDDDD